MDFRAFFDSNAIRVDIAVHAPGIPDLHALAALKFSVDAAANYNFPSGNVRLDRGVGPDGEYGILKGDFSLHISIDEQIFAADDFALDANSMAQASDRFRRSRVAGSGILCGRRNR